MTSRTSHEHSSQRRHGPPFEDVVPWPTSGMAPRYVPPSIRGLRASSRTSQDPDAADGPMAYTYAASSPSAAALAVGDGGEDLTPQSWDHVDIIIRLGSASIRIRIWFWRMSQTASTWLSQDIKADLMISVNPHATLYDYLPRGPAFFRRGRVFAIPWSVTPMGPDKMISSLPAAVSRPLGESTHPECIFAVVAERQGSFFSAVPITTFNRSGTPQSNHVTYINRALSSPPRDQHILRQYGGPGSVRVVSNGPIEHLRAASWLDYGKVCYVVDNIPARCIGDVDPHSMAAFTSSFKSACSEKADAAGANVRLHSRQRGDDTKNGVPLSAAPQTWTAPRSTSAALPDAEGESIAVKLLEAHRVPASMARYLYREARTDGQRSTDAAVTAIERGVPCSRQQAAQVVASAIAERTTLGSQQQSIRRVHRGAKSDDESDSDGESDSDDGSEDDNGSDDDEEDDKNANHIQERAKRRIAELQARGLSLQRAYARVRLEAQQWRGRG